MCFSAPASFIAGAVLTGVGTASLRRTAGSRLYPFAAIPLLFAVQQFIEGGLWIVLSSPDRVHFSEALTWPYLFLSQMLWPIWVPASLLLIEPRKARRRVLLFCLVMGAMVAGYFAWVLHISPPRATIAGHHILYQLAHPPSLRPVIAVPYLLAAGGSIFSSSIPRVWSLGLALAVSYVITLVMFAEHLISVWCYFAAIISLMIFLLVPRINSHLALQGTRGTL
jgi:hypothetical protein